tara:strand:+ start:738 stop:1109 length:372 start_codon:yes stop_codon:yes gene_type:complete
MTNFEKVGLFMKTFGQEVKNKPSLSTDKINQLRVSLINEELEEFKEAIKNNDLKEVADALTDILYVAYGAGHAFGINLDKCFDEVQQSNMSKLGDDEKPIYNEAGKVMKGPKYFKPDLSKFLK